MRPKIFRFRTFFYALYVLVSIATFRHSAEGFASIEGNIVWGALGALAVDAGMILSATGLQRERNRWLLTGLIVSALASTYTQWLFAVSHSALVEIAPGAQWMSSIAQTVINIRIIVLPALLPALAVVYAFASHSKKPVFNWQAFVQERLKLKQRPGIIAQELDYRCNGDRPYASEVAEALGCHVSTVTRAWKED